MTTSGPVPGTSIYTYVSFNKETTKSVEDSGVSERRCAEFELSFGKPRRAAEETVDAEPELRLQFDERATDVGRGFGLDDRFDRLPVGGIVERPGVDGYRLLARKCCFVRLADRR